MIELVGYLLWLLLWAIGIGAAFILTAFAVELTMYLWKLHKGD